MEISQTIHLLGDLLGKVISELESPTIFATEERIRLAAKERRNGGGDSAARLQMEVFALNASEARAVAAAFATYFDLVNIAEENFRVKLLQQRAEARYPAPLNESIGEAIAALKAQGVTTEQMRLLLENLSIELVLTAHPTESRRRTVLSKLQRVSRLLDQLTHHDPSALEQENINAELGAEITALWLTDRSRTTSPAVTDEVRTGLYFVDSVFWESLPRLYADLDRALAEHYPGLTAPAAWLRLASWMGGDRDGNPNVTHAVTAETLRLHRGLAVENHRRSLQDLARRLSLSTHRLPPPSALTAWIEARRPLPPHVSFIEERYGSEQYRLVLSLLAADLAEASRDDMTARLLQREPHTARIHLRDLLAPVEMIASGLPEALARDAMLTTRRQLNIFGLQAARLDIREDSGRFNLALGEVLRALELAHDFEEMPEPDRRSLLLRLLSEPLPALSEHPGVTAAAAETWALFQLITRVRDLYGAELLGPVIISMCRSASDVLTVLLLARWTGCDAGLQIVPLLETIDDLRDASAILESLFVDPVYRAHLQTCNNEQMVMIGYSDSNKDGGYVMANWSLYQAQEAIACMAHVHGVLLTIFHGRGGTTARGGGPANRAIRAQPAESINGRFRLTEQGETIAARYANAALAHRHIEQIVHAVLMASSPETRAQVNEHAAWRTAMDEMSRTALRTYRSLVYDTPGFIDFWQAVTPLDEIKRLHIGSRPAARAKSSAVDKIRAIPWVFSWMQSRFNLPGWYSLGSALLSSPDQGLLREMYAVWPFFRTLLDNTEISLVKADMEIAALYVQLVPDRDLATRLFGLIRAEYERTRDMLLTISGHQTLMEHEPITHNAVQLRNPYIDPLNYIQVEMLRRLRALPDPEGAEATPLREVVILTINGIAAGLRNTG